MRILAARVSYAEILAKLKNVSFVLVAAASRRDDDNPQVSATNNKIQCIAFIRRENCHVYFDIYMRL